MASPVMPTPVLRGKSARKFEAKIAEDLKRPTREIPTPKLEEALNAVLKYEREKKFILLAINGEVLEIDRLVQGCDK